MGVIFKCHWGKKKKKRKKQSADALGKSHKVNGNVAKMAEIEI